MQALSHTSRKNHLLCFLNSSKEIVLPSLCSFRPCSRIASSSLVKIESMSTICSLMYSISDFIVFSLSITCLISVAILMLHTIKLYITFGLKNKKEEIKYALLSKFHDNLLQLSIISNFHFIFLIHIEAFEYYQKIGNSIPKQKETFLKFLLY